MKKFKKLTLMLIAALSMMAIASSCAFGSNSTESTSTDNSVDSTATSSTSESSDSSDSSDKTPDSSDETPDDGDDETPEIGGNTPDDPSHNELCSFTEWELTTEVSCKAAGEMTRYCLTDETHTQTQSIPKRPHDFGNNGLCSCGSSPTFPTLSSEGAIDPTASSDIEVIDTFISEEVGSKNIYVLSTDQAYTAVIDNQGEFWFEFGVPGVGQYAVVSHSNSASATIERYDASAFYVNPGVLEGRIMSDGNFVSTVSVDEVHYHDSWLTIGCIRGTKAGQKITFSIVRVEEASWKPSNIYENIYAKEINGAKAPEGPTACTPIEVPYDASGIYFDETKGWYCMESGEVIYAAITKKAERQFGGGAIAFTDLLNLGSAQNFRIQKSTLPTGDYLIYDYSTMLLTDPTLEGDYVENSYQAKVNSDGLYPVTQELYDFLVAHAAKNPPTTAPDAGYEENAWLSACYYYKQLTPGSEENPIKIDTLGSFTAVRYNVAKPVFYTFTYTPAIENNIFSAYVLNVTTDNVILTLQGTQYRNENGNFAIQNLVFEADSALGVDLKFSVLVASVMNIEVSITALEGSSENPLEATLGEQTLQPIASVNSEGATTYQACYAYTATENGTLTLSSDNLDAVLQLGASTLDQDTVSVEVTAGETILIYVKTSDGSSVDVDLSFTAA